MAEPDDNLLGKKIFFLYPSAVIQNTIAAELTQQEYEVYVIKDITSFKRILKKYPDSIVFANIYEGMNEKEWENWIGTVMADPVTKTIQFGVLVSGDNEPLKKKYQEKLKITCGYTVIKSDLSAAIKQLIDILKKADAKGRRKYLRADTSSETNTTVNFCIGGNYITGVIKDISVVGFSCCFEKDPKLEKNTLFQDLQIKLQAMLIKAEGIVYGARSDGDNKIYVVLFTQRVDPDVRTRIRKYIHQHQQSKMDDELK